MGWDALSGTIGPLKLFKLKGEEWNSIPILQISLNLPVFNNGPNC